MKIFLADWVVPVTAKPIKRGFVMIDENGVIQDVGYQVDLTESDKKHCQYIESYSGVLMPGLINAHTHLELSGLKNMLPLKGQGFSFWLHKLNDIFKEFNQLEHLNEIQKGVKELESNGTVAVGDVSNTLHTLPLLVRSHLEGVVFWEFIDGLGSEVKRADWKFIEMWNKKNKQIKIAPSPHALYSVSSKLTTRIVSFNHKHKLPTSIHWKESSDEIEFINGKRGKLFGLMKRLWPTIGSIYKSNLLKPLRFKNKVKNSSCLYIHCVKISDDDILDMKKKSSHVVLCPRSNKNIFGVLPPLKMLADNGIRFALGTDSYASVMDLDVRNEAALLRDTFPFLTSRQLLMSLTINSAKALGIDSRFGSFTKGKKPGIIQMSTRESIVDPEDFIIQNIEKIRVKNLTF